MVGSRIIIPRSNNCNLIPDLHAFNLSKHSLLYVAPSVPHTCLRIFGQFGLQPASWSDKAPSARVVLDIFALVCEEESVLLDSMILSFILLVVEGEFVLLGSNVFSSGVVLLVDEGETVLLASMDSSFVVESEVFSLVSEEESVILGSIVFSLIVLVDDGEFVSHFPS